MGSLANRELREALLDSNDYNTNLIQLNLTQLHQQINPGERSWPLSPANWKPVNSS